MGEEFTSLTISLVYPSFIHKLLKYYPGSLLFMLDSCGFFIVESEEWTILSFYSFSVWKSY